VEPLKICVTERQAVSTLTSASEDDAIINNVCSESELDHAVAKTDIDVLGGREDLVDRVSVHFDFLNRGMSILYHKQDRFALDSTCADTLETHVQHIVSIDLTGDVKKVSILSRGADIADPTLEVDEGELKTESHESSLSCGHFLTLCGMASLITRVVEGGLERCGKLLVEHFGSYALV
jgi:hypothetical protein